MNLLADCRARRFSCPENHASPSQSSSTAKSDPGQFANESHRSIRGARCA